MIDIIIFVLIFGVGFCAGVCVREACFVYRDQPTPEHGMMGHPGLSTLFRLRDAETDHQLRRLSLREYARAKGVYFKFYAD